MTRMPRNFSCCITRMASGMSRAMRELSSTSTISNGFGLDPAAASRRCTLVVLEDREKTPEPERTGRHEHNRLWSFRRIPRDCPDERAASIQRRIAVLVERRPKVGVWNR